MGQSFVPLFGLQRRPAILRHDQINKIKRSQEIRCGVSDQPVEGSGHSTGTSERFADSVIVICRRVPLPATDVVILEFLSFGEQVSSHSLACHRSDHSFDTSTRGWPRNSLPASLEKIQRHANARPFWRKLSFDPRPPDGNFLLLSRCCHCFLTSSFPALAFC